MKPITEITQGLPLKLVSASPEPAPQDQGVDAQVAESAAWLVVNKLFAELRAIFPAWKAAWPTDKDLDRAKRTWVKAFVSSGITQIEQIRYGLEQCRTLNTDFIPSVGKFISWCQPSSELLGLPTMESAYREACRNAHPASDPDWSHPVVYHAACQTGLYELFNLPERGSRPMFERAYSVTLRAVLAGQPLPEVPKALPKESVVSRPEVGRAALFSIREIIMRGRIRRS